MEFSIFPIYPLALLDRTSKVSKPSPKSEASEDSIGAATSGASDHPEDVRDLTVQPYVDSPLVDYTQPPEESDSDESSLIGSRTSSPVQSPDEYDQYDDLNTPPSSPVDPDELSSDSEYQPYLASLTAEIFQRYDYHPLMQALDGDEIAFGTGQVPTPAAVAAPCPSIAEEAGLDCTVRES